MAVFKNKKLIIFGTGLIAEELYNYFELDSSYKVKGFVKDKKYIKKKTFLGLPVYALENIKKKCKPNEYEAFVAVGYTNLNSLREEKFQFFKRMGYKLANYISSKSSVLNPQKNYENCIVLENSTVQPSAKIGKNVFIWANNLIGHHVKVQDNVYISGNCTVAGSSTVGKNCFLGAGSTISHGIQLQKNCLVGANSLVNKNLKTNSIVAEQPSKIIKSKNLELIKKIIK